jgi:hypothetical protein
MKYILLVSILGISCFAGVTQAEQNELGPLESDLKLNELASLPRGLTVEGDSFSITLTWLNENRPHVVQLDAYTAFSEDGLFGEGPSGPCPISWAAMWITCTQPVSFEVDILSPTGQLVETFEIEDCAAGSYSFELDPKGVSGGVGEIYTIRFKYLGITFPDHRIRILGYN